MQSRFEWQTGDLNSAVESALKGVGIDEALIAASPTNVGASNTLAVLYSQLGVYHGELGLKDKLDKKVAQMKAAKEANEKSLSIYRDLQSKGKLQGADANRLDELEREIVKGDAALIILQKNKLTERR